MSQTQQMESTDSISSQDPRNDEKKKTKSRRPANTAFRQQRLKAWQPILTPKTVLPLFFVVGVIFAPIGGVLVWASAQVQEIAIDYSDCATKATQTFANIPSDKVASSFRTSDNSQPAQWMKSTQNVTYARSRLTAEATVCSVEFTVPNDIGPPVLFYYRLTNFYQNHRRYVKSMDMKQLQGDFRSNGSISGSDCSPLKLDDNGKAYYPCGLIANSLFNDTFKSPVLTNVPSQGGQSSSNETYFMKNTGIAWDSDKDLYKQTAYKSWEVSPPPNWQKQWPDGYNDQNPIPNLHDWEEFQVWMRTAGLPTFSKLALRNDSRAMKAGRYRVDIVDDFPVTAYGGTKSILISTRTIMGGKNPFLGIAYVVVGGLCIVLGALFTATHLIKPRKLGDHRYLTWNNEQPSTATATGRSLRS